MLMSLLVYCFAIIIALITGTANLFKPGEIKAMVTIICLTLPIFQMVISHQPKNEIDGQLHRYDPYEPFIGKVLEYIFYLFLVLIIATSAKTLLWNETQPFEPNIRHTLFVGTLWIVGTFAAGFVSKKVPLIKNLFALW